MTPLFAPEASFLDDYLAFIRTCREEDHRDNHDFDRFGEPPSTLMTSFSVRRTLRAVGAARRGRLPEAMRNLQAALTHNPLPIAKDLVEPDIAEWNWLYRRVADDESRALLIKLLAYRALGNRKVKLPINTPEYWQALADVDRFKDEADRRSTGFMHWDLNRYDLSPIGFPLSLYARSMGVLTQFIVQQYRGTVDSGAIEVEEGDAVIDAGACWGDTALYFAHRAGLNGKVLSFEFLPENVEIFLENMNANPRLSERIELIRHPVWSVSGREVHVAGTGPSTSVSETPSPSSLSFTTKTIDDTVRERGIERIDFIKMDIEGAELEALRGARETLLSSRPKLAICLYHRLSDFWAIPKFLDGLDCGYEFHIRHFTIHSEETVLFARSK